MSKQTASAEKTATKQQTKLQPTAQLLAGVMEFAGESLVFGGKSLPKTQSGDHRFSMIQRQMLVEKIGFAQGNGYIQKVIQRHPLGAPLLAGMTNELNESKRKRGSIKLRMPTLKIAFAQSTLQKAYGSVAKRTLITGTIHIVPNKAKLYEEYDNVCIRDNVINSDTGLQWQKGDLAKRDAARGLDTNAFASKGEVWIDATQTDPTATIHEMLHVNTSPKFRDAVGRAINEGITQRLAVRAVQSTGHSIVGSENTYQQEQAVVTALANIIGEGVLLNAYFTDPTMLINTYETLMGSRSFEMLKLTLDDTPRGYTAALKLLKPPSLNQKISAINIFLDLGNLLGDYLTIIESIINTCSAADKSGIAFSLSSRMNNLSAEQGARLRMALGLPATQDKK